MAHFRSDPGKGQKGKVNYNPGIVRGIVSLAVQEVEGASIIESKNSIKLQFNNDGIVCDVNVQVVYGNSVPILAFRIQQAVKHNVESMTAYKVAKVNVHVEAVEIPEEAVIS